MHSSHSFATTASQTQTHAASVATISMNSDVALRMSETKASGISRRTRRCPSSEGLRRVKGNNLQAVAGKSAYTQLVSARPLGCLARYASQRSPLHRLLRSPCPQRFSLHWPAGMAAARSGRGLPMACGMAGQFNKAPAITPPTDSGA